MEIESGKWSSASIVSLVRKRKLASIQPSIELKELWIIFILIFKVLQKLPQRVVQIIFILTFIDDCSKRSLDLHFLQNSDAFMTFK